MLYESDEKLEFSGIYCRNVCQWNTTKVVYNKTRILIAI